MMRRFVVGLAIGTALAGCATVEENLKNSNSLLLSAREVRNLFVGNTVSSAAGDTFYWDGSGAVTGKGAYGGTITGKWNIADDGRLCISNWNASLAPTGCYRVYFDSTKQQNILVDANGDLKWTVVNTVTGNPYNFQ